MDASLIFFIASLAFFALLVGVWVGGRLQERRGQRDHAATLRVAAELVRKSAHGERESLASHIDLAADSIETRSP